MTNPFTAPKIKGEMPAEPADETEEISSFFLKNKNVYLSAIRLIETRLVNLVEEYNYKNYRNPVHQIKTRVKTPQSIIDKLLNRGLDVSVKSARENLSDIAGIRVICSYIEDIYNISEFISSQEDITVERISDYSKNPKPNGYRSLHLKVHVPVSLLNTTEQVKVEIQIRTTGMDFWASLEHELSYKFPEGTNKTVTQELKQCADVIAETDFRMQRLHNINNNVIRNKEKTNNNNRTPTKVLVRNLRHPVFLIRQRLLKNLKSLHKKSLD